MERLSGWYAPAYLRLSGFTHYWGLQSEWQIAAEAQSSKKRCVVLSWISIIVRRERNARKLPDLWQAVAQDRGPFNYFGVTDTSRRCTALRGVHRWYQLAQSPRRDAVSLRRVTVYFIDTLCPDQVAGCGHPMWLTVRVKGSCGNPHAGFCEDRPSQYIVEYVHSRTERLEKRGIKQT